MLIYLNFAPLLSYYTVPFVCSFCYFGIRYLGACANGDAFHGENEVVPTRISLPYDRVSKLCAQWRPSFRRPLFSSTLSIVLFICP